MEKVDTNLRAVRLLKGGVHMKKTTRRKYTDEFKDEAVKLVTEQGYKITEAARNLAIHDRQSAAEVDKGPIPRVQREFTGIRQGSGRT